MIDFNVEPDRPTGPWQGRVRFAPGGGFAYRPGEILVNAEWGDFAEESLNEWIAGIAPDSDDGPEVHREEGLIAESFTRFFGNFDLKDAIGHLHERGVLAQVNHVVFAHSCCPPHPSSPSAKDFYKRWVDANPFYANPFYANPFYANPFYANPFYANAGCGCEPSCCCGGAAANPFYANPFYANPFYANADQSPFADKASQHTGGRSSSARPVAPPEREERQGVANAVRIAILDTGWAQADAPGLLPNMNLTDHGGDQPDEDGDGFLDPAAGHGTFIAGLIEQLTPGCDLHVLPVLSSFGDGDEAAIAKALRFLADLPDETRPHLVNLSFGGYSPMGMAVLASAIDALHRAGSVVVASAGNDATCFPLYPAALPDVVGVAALDRRGKAATFTNYGPWVRASTLGVDVVSLFFDGFNGAGPREKNYDPDSFAGWARWSGTSFAAPAVLAVLARAVGGGDTPHEAVARLIDGEGLKRHPVLGTIIDLGG